MGISWEKSGDFSKDKKIATDDWDTWGIRLTISWKIGILIGYITSNMIFWCDWSLGIPRYPPIYGNFKSPIYDDKPVDLRSPHTWSRQHRMRQAASGPLSRSKGVDLPWRKNRTIAMFARRSPMICVVFFVDFSICPSQFGGWMNCPSFEDL